MAWDSEMTLQNSLLVVLNPFFKLRKKKIGSVKIRKNVM